jgi:hypothetical protein
MYRYLLIVILVSFLWGGHADASIGRTQGYHIGGMNQVLWEGGIGSARGEIQNGYSQTQQAGHRASGVSVVQMGRGSLTQTATAGGGGLGTARQEAHIEGDQDLLAETTRPLAQRARQDFRVRMDTELFKPNGIGAVRGDQSYYGEREQSATTPYGTSSQSQYVDARQSNAIVTEVDMDPTVRNNVNVNLSQMQTITGP